MKTARQEQQTQKNSHVVTAPKSSKAIQSKKPGKQKRTWFTKFSGEQWAGNVRLGITVTWLGGL